jgi:alpha-ketoglutarate-dependent taurine dioxygenase
MSLHVEPLSESFGSFVKRNGAADLAGLDTAAVIDLFKTRGVLIFRGFDADIAAFERFSDRFTTDWMPYTGGAHERKILNPAGDGTIYSVNFYLGRTQQVMFELPVHADMSYIKHSPVFLFFYCVHPAASGGETAVVDGEAVHRDLSARTRGLLEAQRIVYIRRYPEGDWQTRFGTSDLDEVKRFCDHNDMTLRIETHAPDRRTLTTEYAVTAIPETRWGKRRAFRNSIMPVLWQEENGRDNSLVRFEDGSKFPDDLIAELKTVTRKHRQLVAMRRAEVMMVDNTRVLHGRMTFDDPRRDVAIRMAGGTSW